MAVKNILAQPPRLPLIAPSVLSADFGNIAGECRQVLSAGADMLHLDVMDGHFVPNLTMGPDMCKGIRKALPDAYLDVHLMVTDPAKFVEPFARAGANNFSFHVEVVEPAAIAPLIDRIRGLGMQAGLVINPPTPVEKILPFVYLPDLVLVMSVNPGYSGQSFIAASLDKTRAIKPRLRPEQRLEMDGGLNAETAKLAVAAGCDAMVAGAAVMALPPEQRAGAIEAMRQR